MFRQRNTIPTLLPIFYDPTGRRVYYALAACIATIVALAMGMFFVHNAAVSPTWDESTQRGTDYPREILARSDVEDIPLIGDTENGILNRVVLTERSGSNINLLIHFQEKCTAARAKWNASK